MAERLLTVNEISRILGITKSTVYAWTHQNKIPHIKLGKRSLRFQEEDIVRWVSEKAVYPCVPEECHKPKTRMKKSPKLQRADDDVQRLVDNAKKDILKK